MRKITQDLLLETLDSYQIKEVTTNLDAITENKVFELEYCANEVIERRISLIDGLFNDRLYIEKVVRRRELNKLIANTLARRNDEHDSFSEND